MKDGSDGDDDGGAHGGGGVHVSGLKASGLHRRAEGRKISPYLLPVWVEGARQRLVPWSEASCCECAEPQDDTKTQDVGRETCRSLRLLRFCLSPLARPCFSRN